MKEQTAFKGCAGPLQSKQRAARLVLETGQVFTGLACGASGTVEAPIVVATDLIGYQRVITDKANKGKLVLFTYPQIGNYGIVDEDVQEGCQVAGVIMRSACYAPSNFRMNRTLPEYLQQQGIPAIEDIDTRELTHLVVAAGGTLQATLEVEEEGDE